LLYLAPLPGVRFLPILSYSIDRIDAVAVRRRAWAAVATLPLGSLGPLLGKVELLTAAKFAAGDSEKKGRTTHVR
jgi:hypothetical protein